jgi:hypothetical protein
VAVLHQVAAGANDDVDTVNTSRDGQLGIGHVTSHVSENLGLEAELADLLAVEARLLTGGGRGELDVVDAKVIEGLGNLDLSSGVEEGVGELLALAEGGLDNLELGDIAQEVADGSVGVAGVGARGLVGLEGSADEDQYAVLCCLPCLLPRAREGKNRTTDWYPEWSPLLCKPLVPLPLAWFSSGAGHMVNVAVEWSCALNGRCSKEEEGWKQRSR